MPVCPRCDRTIPNTAITCPHCSLTLAAHGHTGMPLQHAKGNTPLCATCAYDADNSCTFEKRPHAMTCTLYQNSQALSEPTRPEIYRIPWQRKNGFRLALAALIILAVIISIIT
jgi:hypothetical protein